MRTRFRIRRVAKWAGLAVCALIASAWTWSACANSSLMVYSPNAGNFILNRGSIVWLEPGFLKAFGINAHRIAFGQASGRERLLRLMPMFHKGGPLPMSVTLPLWLPFVLIALPTGMLWRSDKQHAGPGYCPNCNYNMTANTSGKCPECGTPTPKPEPPAPSQTPKA